MILRASSETIGSTIAPCIRFAISNIRVPVLNLPAFRQSQPLWARILYCPMRAMLTFEVCPCPFALMISCPALPIS